MDHLLFSCLFSHALRFSMLSVSMGSGKRMPVPVILSGKLKTVLFEPCNGADGRAVAVRNLQGETAEPEQFGPAQPQVAEVFDVDDILFPKELPVPGQVVDRVDADHVKADALVVPGQDQVQDGVVDAGKSPK